MFERQAVRPDWMFEQQAVRPDWRNVKINFGHFERVNLVFGKKIQISLVNYKCYWTNFHCCKRQKIEQSIYPAGHTDGKTTALASIIGVQFNIFCVIINCIVRTLKPS